MAPKQSITSSAFVSSCTTCTSTASTSQSSSSFTCKPRSIQDKKKSTTLKSSAPTRATLAKAVTTTTIKPLSTSTITRKSKSSSIRELTNEVELKRNLKQNDDDQILVVKCHASYCAGCRGVAPKYKKIAAAYKESNAPVSFYEMDYVKNESFCKQQLGVSNLPFFAVFRGNQLMSAESIGWRSINHTLVDNIEHAIHQN